MLLLNGAGASAADPILNGLGLEWVIAASTMDAASFANAWIDQTAGFPGTTSVSPQLSPTIGTVTQGSSGAYANSTHQYAISSTAGLSVGDYLYLSGGSGGGTVTGGLYRIASVVDAIHVTLVSDPLSGASSNVTGISYEVAWRTTTTIAGTAPTVSSAAGQVNYYKAQLADSVANAAQQSDTNTIRNAPALAGTTYISVGGLAADGTQRINTTAPTLAVLSGWASFGGVAIVAFDYYGGVGTNPRDFRHSDASLTEKPLAVATTNGLSLTAGDGLKRGRILLKSLAGGIAVAVDVQTTVDTTAPTVVFTLNGR